MFVFEFTCSDPPRRAALSHEGSTKCACLREGDAPRAGLERREDLVLASKLRQEVFAARGREKGRVPRGVVAVLVPLPVSAASDFTLFRCTLFCSALVAQIKELLAKKHIYEPRGPYVCI